MFGVVWCGVVWCGVVGWGGVLCGGGRVSLHHNKGDAGYMDNSNAPLTITGTLPPVF